MNAELKQDLTDFYAYHSLMMNLSSNILTILQPFLKHKVSGRMAIYIGKKKGFCQKILSTNIMTSISTGMKMRLLWMETVIQAWVWQIFSNSKPFLNWLIGNLMQKNWNMQLIVCWPIKSRSNAPKKPIMMHSTLTFNKHLPHKIIPFVIIGTAMTTVYLWFSLLRNMSAFEKLLTSGIFRFVRLTRGSEVILSFKLSLHDAQIDML